MKVELLFITPDAEKLIERAGRTAYQSFEKQKEGSEKKFIRSIVKRGHLSVIEHAYATFKISGVSRAFTHQLVRHRLCSFTQESQRYVNFENFKFVTPESIKSRPIVNSIYQRLMEDIRDTYKYLQSAGIKNEDARFVLPNATETEIVVTANFRQWYHIIQLRGSKNAQWEIRQVAIKVLEILQKFAPSVFGEFKIDKEKETIKCE